MKGLLLKDLLNLKKQGLILLVLLVFYFVLSLTSDSMAMFGGALSIVSAILPITALSYDERAKWDRYALTMPVSRSQMVVSKYLLGILLCGTAFVFSTVCLILFDQATVAQSLLESVAFVAIGLFFLAVLLPILFRFGVEKGRLLMLLLIVLPVALVFFLSKLGISLPDDFNWEQLLPFLPVALLIVMVLSVLLSIRIYKKKEIS